MRFRIKKIAENIDCYPYVGFYYLVQVKVRYLYFFTKWITLKTFANDADYEFGDYDAEYAAEQFLKSLE